MSESCFPAQPELVDLRVRVLGPPRIEWRVSPLTVPRRQARALLFYLSTQRNAVPREHVEFLFWPDLHPAAARRNLTRLLTHVRRALPAAGVLLGSADDIGLDPVRVWCDATELERLSATEEPQRRNQALRQAVGLWRGPFLAGFSLPECYEFEAWSLQQQAAWERLYLEVLEALVEECTGRGAWEEAIAYAQHYLETDDLSEEMHRRLIGLYAAHGQRSEALRQFERCATVLERDLGVSPAPETRAVYQTILRGNISTPSVLPCAAWTILPSLDVPMLGRDQALDQLQQAYARSRLGHGGLVLVSGEAGIGKSRLVQEFIRGLPGEETVVMGCCHEGEQGLPYGPLADALRDYARRLGWQALVIEPFDVTELKHLVPELQVLLPDLPASDTLAPLLEQGRLLQALTHWLQSLAARHPPLIVCIDDLHWADEATLSWLGYLLRRLQATPLLVLGTCRSGEDEALAPLHTQLSRLGLVQEIPLVGLRQEETLRLIRHLSGQTAGAERFSWRLQRITDGNPFFLLETLHGMFDAGVLWKDEKGWSTAVDDTTEDYHELPLPDSLQRVIRDRVGRLSAQSRQVLEAAAVVGQRFSLDLVHLTSGRRDSEVVDALEMLTARQIVTEGAGVYRFKHDLTRAVVYRDLSYGRRRLLHGRAGGALEKLRPNDVASLARHFDLAGQPAKAAAYYMQAGQRAQAVYAYAEARACCDRAIALLKVEESQLWEPEDVAANHRLQLEALCERGWPLRLVGEMAAFRHDSEEIARLIGRLCDRRELARLAWREAQAHRWYCCYDQAQQAAREGIQLSQEAEDASLELACQRELGLAARAMGDYEQARAALDRALSLAVEAGNAQCEIHVLGNLSTLCWYQGDHPQAMDLARRELARCDAEDMTFHRRLALSDMADAAAALGQVDQAREWLLESLCIAHEIADRSQEILCLSRLGWLAVSVAQPSEALEHLQAALALAEEIDSRSEQSGLHAALAEAYRLAGDPVQALPHARRAVALAEADHHAHDRQVAGQVLVRLEEAAPATAV